MKLKRIKLSEIINDQLTKEEIDLLKGGNYKVGCDPYGACKSSRLATNTQWCTNGDGICHSGVI